jgi:hypothetical protein
MNAQTTHSDRMNRLLVISGVRNPGPMLQQAIIEDSNRLLDWLWYADQMTNAAERYYCLERALYINPNDGETLRGIAALRKQAARLAREAAPARRLNRLFRTWMHI